MSQSAYNAMERIYRHTVDRGINGSPSSRDAAQAVLARGRNLHGCVQSS